MLLQYRLLETIYAEVYTSFGFVRFRVIGTPYCKIFKQSIENNEVCMYVCILNTQNTIFQMSGNT